MLKVKEDEVAQELDTWLQRALTQPLVIEPAGRDAVVMLSLAEFERLQDAEDEHWAACARRANTEGYLDHDHEVRQRLAEAMRARCLNSIRQKSGA
ncbi:hypothetical protein H3H37_19085 [Duganella sp. LX20W]|uniref:Antitoxin n=1 Tax=Rugamonas brunnea TaxID=2758569 RepID=A0A7W2EV40_9BURK|nr:hypothetical protein [Rugamonas brunnea]MBA5639168.1 hypothetical protein [Rugamonas brunnea]